MHPTSWLARSSPFLPVFSKLRIAKLAAVAVCIVTFGLLEAACSAIPGVGACHRANGEKITHLYDADGAKWRITRVDTDILGEPVTYCGVSLNPLPNFLESQVSFVNPTGLYLTDESGEAKFYAKGRTKGKVVFSTGQNLLGPSTDGLEWY